MAKPHAFLTVSRSFLWGVLVAGLVACGRDGLPNATPSPVAITGPVRIDPAELARFADAFFPEQMRNLNLPGLVIVIVQDGETLFAKGYGLANLETGAKFDPDSTVVRIGSISKLFVATAVMQLVEQGKLDLHADVNTYLADAVFQVDDTYGEPVTLAHLLTHTSGYGESAESSQDPATVPSLAVYLAQNMPPRLAPPGERWIYSGHGNAIAALVVEEVSGVPFDAYVSEQILQPLKMEQTRYLLAPPLPENMAMGYAYDQGHYVPQAIEYYGDYPGAMLVSTAADIARFMIANLEGGCYQANCVLEPDTLAEMQQPQPDYPCGDCTLGFAGGVKNGQRLIGHSGALHGFGSILELLPDHQLGYFFAFNAECWESSACDVIPAFREAFLDRFFQ
jgi:CubicO group peptidase (beta-lactamase class C family)